MGVEDASIAVPEGATAVIRGTHEWWHARGSARYVIANDWLRRQFSPQPFQVVLQTWHGSMLKRIGLDRPNLLAAKLRAIAAEQAKWDALLSQNRHSTEILRSAYAWDKEMFEEGYPRNDRSAAPTGAGSANSSHRSGPDRGALRPDLAGEPDRHGHLLEP